MEEISATRHGNPAPAGRPSLPAGSGITGSIGSRGELGRDGKSAATELAGEFGAEATREFEAEVSSAAGAPATMYTYGVVEAIMVHRPRRCRALPGATVNFDENLMSGRSRVA